MKLCVTLSFFCLFAVVSFGQRSISDSLEILTREQKFLNIDAQKIDSVQAFFIRGTDSLKQQYHERLTKIVSAQRRLEATWTKINSVQSSLRTFLSADRLDSMQSEWRSKVDSLTLLSQYSAKVSGVLDSIRAVEEKTVAELNAKVQSLKEVTVARLNDLNLPPQLSEKVTEASSRISEFQMRTSDFSIPSLSSVNGLEIGGLKELDLASVEELNLNKFGELTDIGKLHDVSKVTGAAGEHMKTFQKVTTGNVSGIADIGNLAESHTAELSGLGQIKDQMKTPKMFKDLTENIRNPDSLKAYALEEVKEIAVDHFVGKEEHLAQAMQTLARYKSKYPNLNSISEATRKPANEMKGKPLIERIVPGIAVQVQKKGDDFMVDFNPYARYRFTGRFSAGLGWNQRFAYNLDHKQLNERARLFGPRLFGEFKLWRGFSPRTEIEIMNTIIPARMRSHSVDPLHREWLWGAFAGIKKEYQLMKNIMATASVMMRLYNPDHKSPYADVVNARIGFEFPMKKKLSSPNQ